MTTAKPCTDNYIVSKARLVLASYPTLGVGMRDLVQITLELCADDGHRPQVWRVKRLIKSLGLTGRRGRYFSEQIQRCAEGEIAYLGVQNSLPAP